MAKNNPEVDTLDAESLTEAVVKASKLPGRSALLEFVDAVFEEAGGPGEFAKLLMQAYKDSSTPPSIRARVLDVVTKILLVTHEKTPRKFDSGDVSEDDLKYEIREFLNRV